MAKKTTRKPAKKRSRAKAPELGTTETTEAPPALDAPGGAEGVPEPVKSDPTPAAPLLIDPPKAPVRVAEPDLRSFAIRVDIYRGAKHDHLIVDESELADLRASVKKAKGKMSVGPVAKVGDRVCATYRNGFHGEVTAIEGAIATIKGPGKTICVPLAECAPSK